MGLVLSLPRLILTFRIPSRGCPFFDSLVTSFDSLASVFALVVEFLASG